MAVSAVNDELHTTESATRDTTLSNVFMRTGRSRGTSRTWTTRGTGTTRRMNGSMALAVVLA